jgi:hypothetical protein
MEKLADLAKKKADDTNASAKAQDDARVQAAADALWADALWQSLHAAVMDAAGHGQYIAHIDKGGGHEDNDPGPDAWNLLRERMKSEGLTWEPLRSISNKPGGMVRLWVAFGPLSPGTAPLEPGEVPRGTIVEKDSRPF